MKDRRYAQCATDFGKPGARHVGRLRHHLPGFAVGHGGAARYQYQDIVFDQPAGQCDVPVVLRNFRVTAANHRRPRRESCLP